MKLTYTCPICSKQLKFQEEIKLGDEILYAYTCGHMFSKKLATAEDLDFNAADNSGKHARHYQETGIKFIIESDFNCIIGDQMRLGKTPQALLALKNKYADRTPVLILVKSANLWQWIREYKVWTDTLPNGIFPIVGGTAFVPPGFSAYICSMDTFSLQGKCKCGHTYHEAHCKAKKGCDCKVYQEAQESIRTKLQKLPFKLVIADEAHSFKNSDSNRSQALVKFMQFMNIGESLHDVKFTCTKCGHEWTEEAKEKFDKRIGHQVLYKSSTCAKCGQYMYIQSQAREVTKEDKPCGLVLLTGTPILNRADEYFIPLNLVNPEKFPSQERFRREWLEQNHKGTWSRIKSYKLDSFKREVSKYLLRREKEDVYTDLPAINRIFTLIEPDKTAVKERYNSILDKLELDLANKINPTYWDMKEHLSELRALCGIMKVPYATDFLEACALDTASKYAIGIHHVPVRDTLFTMLGGSMNCYKLSGEDSSDRKDFIMRDWESSNKQFLIINMLAGGVGMDFHYCDNVLILERQWNSEIEAQFEFRFYNPDKSIKQNSTTIEYIIARGTIDEIFYDMIEGKRKDVGESMYNHFDPEKDVDSFRQLVERTIATRL